jgi:hypothetical protein
VAVLYLFKNIMERFYALSQQKRVHLMSFDFAVNLVALITFIVWNIRHFSSWIQYDDSKLKNPDFTTVIIFENISSDPSVNIYIILAILIAFQWSRSIYAFQVTRFFGPLIKILFSMFEDLAKFMVIFLICFFIFCCAAQVLFRESPNYTDLQTTMRTMFAAGLGAYEYSDFDDLEEISPTIGYIFMTVFLFVILITLLNFIIAILSDTYSALSQKSQSLYLREVILLRQRLSHTKTLSCLVSSFVPLNALVIPLFPFLVILKSERLNTVILFIMYIPVALFAVATFITFLVILYPFAVLAAMWTKFRVLFAKTQAKWCGRFGVFLQYFFFAWLILLASSLLDLFFYTVELFTPSVKTRRQEGASSDHDMNKISFALLLATLKETQTAHEEACGLQTNQKNYTCFIPTRDVVLRIQNNMLITDQINHLVIGGAHPKNPKAFDEKVKCEFEKEEKFGEDAQQESQFETFSPLPSPKAKEGKGGRITSVEAKKYLINADADDILDEFNNIKTFLYNNCTEIPQCPDSLSREEALALDGTPPESQKCTDILTML